MVTLKIIVEGGALPGDDISAQTFDNSEKFRESFHLLLSEIFPPAHFNLEIEPGAGYKQAVRSFKKIQGTRNCVLLIDLDAPKTKRNNKLHELELTDCSDSVFFMVQEMEAWILSQPECIIKTYSENFISKGNLLEDELFTISPEEIYQPSEKLRIILGRYFFYEKNGVKKKKKYGKLKDGPTMIAILSLAKLINTFEDVHNLSNYLRSN